MPARLFFLFAIISVPYFAEPMALAPDVIVEQFCAAQRGQERALAGASMDVDIEASLPSLKKQGRLHALRKISTLGRITYEKLLFEGDGTVKHNVITRYLTAESQTQTGEMPSLALTPENYKFKYKGRSSLGGRPVHLFSVTPKSRRVGLFKGDVWIDSETYLRVQESGSFVKNPSLFLKRIAFVRKYEIRDGISVPRHIQSVVETRLVGKAELHIEYSNFSRDEQTPAGSGEGYAQ